jgi:hypothetical protein
VTPRPLALPTPPPPPPPSQCPARHLPPSRRLGDTGSALLTLPNILLSHCRCRCRRYPPRPTRWRARSRHRFAGVPLDQGQVLRAHPWLVRITLSSLPLPSPFIGSSVLLVMGRTTDLILDLKCVRLGRPSCSTSARLRTALSDLLFARYRLSHVLYLVGHL